MQSRARARARAGVLAALSALVVPAAAAAQYVDVPRPPAYALRGVTVVQADGERREDVTVVLRGSLIETLRPNAPVPADAKLLEGESLVVYPGLIDADGEAEHEFPDPEIDRSEIEIWDAPRSLQGFMPARRLVPFLTVDGEELSDQRQEGIVAAAVHPDDAMMPGRGALLLFRRDAETPEALVIRGDLGPAFELTGGDRVYPGTLFGVVAFIRQAFEDARHRSLRAAAYEEDPRGLTMPSYDPADEVLQQVLAGELPVYFEANEAVDILRVVGLADEYDFEPIILGGAEAWRVADELRRREIPVLVSMDFPEPRRYEPPEEGEPMPALDAAAQRERDRLEDRYANAGRLEEAGVTFALTSGGTGEILEGARKAVEYGLSERAALTALSRTPAALYGVPSLGRIDEGLPATFIVADGPLFDEDTRIVYTFVEGLLEEGEEPGDSDEAGDAESAADFAGVWSITIEAPGETMEGTMEIEQDGATFTGTIRLEETTVELRDGTIDGNEISMTGVMRQGDQRMEIAITGTIDGDEASGEADAGPMGVAEWTATREGPGGAR